MNKSVYVIKNVNVFDCVESMIRYTLSEVEENCSLLSGQQVNLFVKKVYNDQRADRYGMMCKVYQPIFRTK